MKGGKKHIMKEKFKLKIGLFGIYNTLKIIYYEIIQP